MHGGKVTNWEGGKERVELGKMGAGNLWRKERRGATGEVGRGCNGVMRSGNWVRKKWIGECGLYYEGRLQEGGGTREDKILHRDFPSSHLPISLFRFSRDIRLGGK